jgi:hypothetical protein
VKHNALHQSAGDGGMTCESKFAGASKGMQIVDLTPLPDKSRIGFRVSTFLCGDWLDFS